MTVRRFAYAFLRFGSCSSSAAKAKAESKISLCVTAGALP
jgi:hypothetical protein